MKVQVNTDNHILGSAELSNYIEKNFLDYFDRYKSTITRIEVYLSDENSHKRGEDDKRCLLEARIANHQPIVVGHHAETIHQAITAAAEKLLRSLDSMVGKLSDHIGAKDFMINPE